MLYQIVEYQRATMAALAIQASRAFIHPMSPFSYVPGASDFAACWEMLSRVGSPCDEPSFSITAIQLRGCVVPVEETVLLENPFCRLLRFTTGSAKHEAGQPSSSILLCAPLAGHHAVMLREVVESLLHEHIVYVTDWSNARNVPVSDGPFHLDDYVLFIKRLIRQIEAESLHVLAICQATVPTLAAVALLASEDEPTPQTLTLIGGPIDARRSPTAIGDLAARHSLQWFQRNLIHAVPEPYMGVGRQVCPSFVQVAGLAAADSSSLTTLYRDFCLSLARGDADLAQRHGQALDAYNAVLDMAAEFYLDTISTVFQDFRLPRGTWQVQGHAVRPQDIRTTALLTIEGECDEISGRGQTHAAHDLCQGIALRGKRLVTVPRCGHYDLFSGPCWHREVFPTICDMTRRGIDARASMGSV
ncbi:polyhydroxyalkanoate depolymerase [Cupriavidus sp. a3]|uniref:polyhydroxyalkanoate depolymerase n=1 Tax=Cupriavidus sp. a3 TaxID=3242158 RepID=UPI003D9C6780